MNDKSINMLLCSIAFCGCIILRANIIWGDNSGIHGPKGYNNGPWHITSKLAKECPKAIETKMKTINHSQMPESNNSPQLFHSLHWLHDPCWPQCSVSASAVSWSSWKIVLIWQYSLLLLKSNPTWIMVIKAYLIHKKAHILPWSSGYIVSYSLHDPQEEETWEI